MATVDMLSVADLVREVAAEEILPRWRNLTVGDVRTKSKSGDLVTVADHAAEVALTMRLGEAYPNSHVVGEEAVAANPRVLEYLRRAEPVWVIDPIDGTRVFSQGGTTFDVMVALVVGGRPIAGWIYAPAEDILYLGEAGSGAEMHAGGQVIAIQSPGEVPLSMLLAKNGVSRVDDVPIMDTLAVSLKLAEAMVDLARATGIRHSRHGFFNAVPSESRVEEVQRFYGVEKLRW